MYCIYCGKEIPDDSVFCPVCGKPTAEQPLPPTDEQPAVPPAPEPVPMPTPAFGYAAAPAEPKPPREKKPVGALAIVGFVFSVIAFVAGFILLTMSLCGSAAAFDLYYVLPAFAGLAMCIFALKKPEEGGKALALTGIALSGFILLYYLMAAFVLTGMML